MSKRIIVTTFTIILGFLAVFNIPVSKSVFAKSKARFDCSYSISGFGIGYNYNECSFGAPDCPAETTAKKKAYDNTVGKCSTEGCQSSCGPYFVATGSRNGEVFEDRVRVEPNPNGDGTSIITIDDSSMCFCSGYDGFTEEPMAIFPKTPLPAPSLLTPIRDFFRRLFPSPFKEAPGGRKRGA
jgi:hypothetical protein